MLVLWVRPGPVSAQVLQGRVVDRAGGPVASALIQAGPESARTDAAGVFRLTRPLQSAELEVRAEGYQWRRLAVQPAPMLIVLDTRPLQLHEGVVVSARRQDADVFVVPRAVTVVSGRDLAQRLPRSTPEALLDASGVFVQKTNHGGGSPIVRGLVGNQVLVLVDGVRLNNATFRLGPNQYLNTIDPATIERIEVVRGAGSVLYGTDALGGVVHVVTRTPVTRGGGWHLDARALVRVATGAAEQSGRVELEGGRGSVAWLGGVSVKAFGDVRAGGALGVRAPSAYEEADADLKVRWQPTVARTLTLSFQRVRQEDVDRFDQVTQRGFSSWAFDPQERSMAVASYVQRMPGKVVEQFSATGAVQHTEEARRWQRVNSSTTVVERDQVRVVSGSADLQWRPLAGWRIASGVDATADHVGSTGRETSLITGASTARRGLYADGAQASSWAVFTHAERRAGRLALDGGARYAWSGVHASAPGFGNFTLQSDAIVGEVGVSLAASSELRPYVHVWQGYRAPNIDDVSALGSFDFGVEVPPRG